MEDLISKGALFNALAQAQDKADCFSVIQGMPTIDAEPVRHGHWTHAGYCSVCDGEQLGRTDEYGESLDTSYCPHCGAKMDEARSNEH